jgi:hypothetical protein
MLLIEAVKEGVVLVTTIGGEPVGEAPLSAAICERATEGSNQPKPHTRVMKEGTT